MSKKIFAMHQSMDPPDAGWNLINNWFDDDDSEDDTVDTKIPEGHCPKCKAKMRELNTGLRKRMYACPNCDK